MTLALVCAGILCGLFAAPVRTPEAQPVSEGAAPYRQGFTSRLR